MPATFIHRVAALTLLLLAFGVAGNSLAAETRVETQPAGASVWLKQGRKLTYLGVTPFSHDFQFRSDKDSKRIEIRRMGYETAKLHVKAAEPAASVALSPIAQLHSPPADAQKVAGFGLRNRNGRVFFSGGEDPLAGLRLAVRYVTVEEAGGIRFLRIGAVGDDGFGGRELKRAMRKPKNEDARRAMAEIFLAEGVNALLQTGNRLLAGSDVDQIVVEVLTEVQGLRREYVEKYGRKSQTIVSGQYIITHYWTQNESYETLVDATKTVETIFIGTAVANGGERHVYAVEEVTPSGAILLK